MAAQVTNYQCPSCTGPLHFVGASGKLECDYCGSTYDVAEIEALYAEQEDQAAAAEKIFSRVCPGVELSVLPGGQPVYYYIISIE